MPTETDAPERLTPAELRSALLEAGDKLNELRSLDAEKRGDTFRSDVRDAVDTIHTLDAQLQAYERGAATPAPAAPEARGPQAAFAPTGGTEIRTLADAVTDHEQYAEWAKARRFGSGALDIEVRGSFLSPEQRTLITESDSDTPAAGLLLPKGSPAIPPSRQRRLFVRDVISVQQTGLASIPYVRELNAGTNETGASSVAEGVAKPEATMSFEGDDAPVRKIAAWVPVTEEIISDIPTLQGYINNRLGYMVALREELEILYGNGVSPDLKGIMEYSGVQTQSAVSGDFPATIAGGIGKVENVDGEANAVVIQPVAYWTFVSSRHSTFLDGAGLGQLPFAAAPPTIWGLNVVRSRSVTSGHAIVGDFQMGATLFDRLSTTIRVGNQHSTYFVENKVAILAEERVALAVHRPDYFVDVTLPS